MEKLAILNTYAFTIDLVPHVFGDYGFAGHKHEYMGKYTKRRIPTRRKADLCKGIKKKAQPTRRIWAKHPLGLDPGPSKDTPDKNQAKRAQWRCGSTTSATVP